MISAETEFQKNELYDLAKLASTTSINRINSNVRGHNNCPWAGAFISCCFHIFNRKATTFSGNPWGYSTILYLRSFLTMTITEGSCVIGLMRLSSQLFKLKTSILQTDVSTQPHTVMTTERINTYWQFHPYNFLWHVTDLTLPCKTS